MNHQEEQRAQLLKSLASTVLLAGLLIGVPLVLALGVGWPLPRTVPSGGDVSTALKTGAVPPSLILKAISLVVWVLWLQMMAGVGVELWAHFHGRVAPRVSFIPSFMQSLSARMIGTVLVIAFAVQNPGTALADNQDLLAPTTIELDLDDESAEPTEGLRNVAERYLGNPDRWTEVFVLDQGHDQDVGGSLSEPARLQPEWNLVMSADAPLPESAATAYSPALEAGDPVVALPAGPGRTTITVRSGDTLWGLADQHLDDPDRWVDISDSNQNIIQDPNVIVPGWQLRLPSQDSGIELPPRAGAPGNQQESAAASEADSVAHHYQPTNQRDPVDRLYESTSQRDLVMAYATSETTAVARVPAREAEEPPAPNRQKTFAYGGLGVFACSLGWILARLRRSQRRGLLEGRMPPPATSGAVVLEQQLADVSDPDRALFLDASLRVLSSQLEGSPQPEIIGASMDSNGISLLLATPSPAPPGFNANGEGTVWEMFREADLGPLLAEADGVPAPVPALVAVGKRGEQEFLLNLGHAVALNLEGDQEAINEFCSTAATQLASSHLADDLTVLCVGFGQDFSVFDRVKYAPDAVAATEQIGNLQREHRALFGVHPSAVDSMSEGSRDQWPPIVVLIPGHLSERDASALLELCGSSVHVVARGLRGAAWSGHFNGEGLLIQPIGLQVEPYGLTNSEVSAISDFAAATEGSHPPDSTTATKSSHPPDSTAATEGSHPPDSTAATEGSEDAESTEAPVVHLTLVQDDAPAVNSVPIGIEVQVLGPVVVVGAAHPPSTRRALDLLAYLAFHPEGADRDQLRTHIWSAEEAPSESTLLNTIHRARKALGTGDDGGHYLPRLTSDGIYRLRPEVGTDVGRFEELVAAARREPTERRREMLRAALELVRGIPFTGKAASMYRWADFGLRTHIDCMVDSAAHELAELCMAAGDAESTRWAASTSLRLVGICEECYRWRLMAAAKNPTEVRQIMGELVNLVRRENDLSQVDHLINPELWELYERLIAPQPPINA